MPSFKGMIPLTRVAQAEILLELGQTDRAVQLFEETLPAAEASGGNGLAPHLYSLGVCYQRLGQLDKAEALFRRVQSTESFPGWNRLSAGTILASILADRGETAEAEKLLIEGVDPKYNAVVDPTLRAKQHRILGDVYLKTGQASEAEKNFRLALDTHGAAEGKQLSEEATCWLGVARALEAQKMPTDALAAVDKSRHLLHELTVKILPGLPEPQQLAFLTNEDEPTFQASLALMRPHTDSLSVERVATWVLNRKGLAQQAVAQRMLLARQANDPALANLVKDWMAVRHQLAKMSVSGEASDSAASREQMAELTQREQELASRLGQAKVQTSAEQPWYEVA
jgi:tetratricopeptide (TPR) repeat protein